MKVRFLGSQQFAPAEGKISHKVFYSSDNSQKATPIDLDDGRAHLSFSGEKPLDIKCTPEVFHEAAGCTPGEIYELVLSPNPQNPRFNICSGIQVSK